MGKNIFYSLREVENLESEGKTVVLIFDARYTGNGLIAVADTIREDAKDMIKEIKKMDKEVNLSVEITREQPMQLPRNLE